MSSEKDSKLKALQLTLDRLDKTYGKGTVMKMGDSVHENIELFLLDRLVWIIHLVLVAIQEEE